MAKVTLYDESSDYLRIAFFCLENSYYVMEVREFKIHKCSVFSEEIFCRAYDFLNVVDWFIIWSSHSVFCGASCLSSELSRVMNEARIIVSASRSDKEVGGSRECDALKSVLWMFVESNGKKEMVLKVRRDWVEMEEML